MQAIIAAVLIFAVAVNGGVYTATSQIHGVAYQAPTLVHAAPTHYVAAPTVLHTASSSSYKIRAPAAKILTVSSPIVRTVPVHTYSAGPLVHMSHHGVLLH